MANKIDALTTSACKVSELFTAAGEAFTQLAAISEVMQTSLREEDAANGPYSNHNSRSCWTAADTELLQSVIRRFGDDLRNITERIKDKTKFQIKSTFKKIDANASDKGDDPSISTQYSNSNSRMVSSFDDLNNLRAPAVAADRSSLSLGISCSTSESITSSKNTTKQSNLTGSGANSTITAESSELSTRISSASPPTNSNSTASICPSSSPFLHFRKSADITLNMLNARDHSDEEDRKAGLSVFNST